MSTISPEVQIADLLYEWDVESGALGWIGRKWPTRSQAPREVKRLYGQRGSRLASIARRGWRPTHIEVIPGEIEDE